MRLAAIVLTFSFRTVPIDFLHQTGARGEKHLIETMGSGVVAFDYDGDSDPDLYFVNTASEGALFRNDGAGRFENVTVSSGLSLTGYGMGAVAGDIDNDGDPDLYVTHYGSNQLFRNEGDGSFVDITAEANVGDPNWGTSAVFSDLDDDGLLDLYVTNYVDWNVRNHPDCSQRVAGAKVRSYCLPDVFRGLPDVLYRNRGDGSFEDLSEEAGIVRPDGKGLGVVAFDYDGDGLPDLYVANDTVPNFLFHNEGGMHFREVALASGVAYDEEGNALAGMGVDASDYDRDGDLDLFVTNFEGETNTLYRNEANGFFTDVTSRAGLARDSLRALGFGTSFADLDSDGLPDLIVANGHVLDNVEILREGSNYAQSNQIFRNLGDGRFELEKDVAGFETARVSRGLATLDVESDGDVDLVFTSSDAPPELLINDGSNGNGMKLFLVGRKSNRDGLGARVSWETFVLEQRAGSSYLSQNERGTHLGLGREERLDFRIDWPSGHRETIEAVGANQVVVVLEGAGIVSSRPFDGTRQPVP